MEDGHPKSPGLPRRRSVVEDAAEARPAVVGPACGRELGVSRGPNRQLRNDDEPMDFGVPYSRTNPYFGNELIGLNCVFGNLGVETGESAVLNPIKMGTGHQYHQSARMKDLNSKNKGFNQQRRKRFNQPEARSDKNILYIYIYIYIII